MITVAPARPDDTAIVQLMDELSETLFAITGSSGRTSFDASEMALPGACVLLATVDEKPVGCGVFRPLKPGIAEIKRMYARPGTNGVGEAVLAALEQAARQAGYREAWLETRAINTRAVRFYESHGYRRIDNFGKYAGREEAVCFAKTL